MMMKPPTALRLAVLALLVTVPMQGAAAHQFDIVALAPSGPQPSVLPLRFDSLADGRRPRHQQREVAARRRRGIRPACHQQQRCAYRAYGLMGDPVREQGIFCRDFAANTTIAVAQNTPGPNRDWPNPFEAETFGDPALNNRAPVADAAFTFENPGLAGAGINDRLVVAVNAAGFGVAPCDGRRGTIVGSGSFDPPLWPRPFLILALGASGLRTLAPFRNA